VSTELPQGWIEVSVDEINLHKSQNITPSDFPEEEFELFSVPIFPTGKPENVLGKDIGSSKQVVSPGDVLLCKINPRINRVWTVGEKTNLRQIASSEWINVRNPLICANYLKYAFSKKYFRELLCSEVAGVGGSLTRAQPKKVGKYTVPIAPLNEQIRIADKLDSVLAKVDAAQTRLEKIPTLLKRFRQSVLAAAVSGKLTEEWRGTKAIDLNQSPIIIGAETTNAPKGWYWRKLVDIAVLESGHTPRKSVAEYWDNGEVPWICLQDIRAAHGKVITQTKYMPTMKGIENSSARLLPKGTVCFSRDISVGFTTIMGREMSTTQHFANWICGEDLNNYFLMLALMAAKDYLTISGQGTTVKTIYMPALKEFRLLTPPLTEQTEIVRRVESLFTLADTVEKQYLETKKRIDRLTQSLLAKAFRGELVPQDPNDEPAAELLKRIQAERNAQPPVKNKRAKSA
jgi:type I restriction enzyme S subunit